MSEKPGQTYYDILDVSIGATGEEIHQAFLRSKNTYSPSSPALYSVFSEDEAKELLRLIDEAYAVLGHAERRKLYDEKLENGNLEATNVSGLERTLNDKSEAPIRLDRHKEVQTDDIFEEEIQNQSIFDGTFLQRVRLYKKITLEEMASVTRIGRNYLMAVENNDFESLPAPVFIRGFIVQYAKSLGLDYKKVSDSYMNVYKSSRDED